jgi:hypothetical protein
MQLFLRLSKDSRKKLRFRVLIDKEAASDFSNRYHPYGVFHLLLSFRLEGT